MAAQAPDAVALAMVPGCQRGKAPLQVQRLHGGSVNDVWLVDTVAGRFVLRVDGAEWRRPGVDRCRELVLHRAAADAGLAPRVVATSPALDAWVTEYVDGIRWQERDFADRGRIVLLGETLAALHRLPLPAGGPEALPLQCFDPLAIAGAYAERALRHMPQCRERVALLAENVRRAAAQLATCAPAPAIVHGDPAANNLLGRQRLWLVDWEYAQIADPVFDVAAVLVYHPSARTHLRRLLRACGLQAALRAGRLQSAARIHDALFWLWHLARGENVPADAGNWQLEWAN